jgi:hypothetical protein
LIGLNNLWTDPSTTAAPELNRKKAVEVLAKIDAALAWQAQNEAMRDQRFVELGKYLCEVRSGQYWRIENLHSFDEFLEKRFPQSRRKAYYLMAIHEQIPKPIRHEIANVGWTKAKELVKVVRHDGEFFDGATWLHSAKHLSKDDFKLAVERHITGKNVEAWDLLYFKVSKSQISIVEDALEKASLMLGAHRSRGYCLEMICADFLAGVSIEEPSPADLVRAIRCLLQTVDRESRAIIVQDLA